MTYKFCSHCGERTITEIPNGDNRERTVCRSCDTVHYQNPKLIVGCIVENNDQILLCKRSIEPQLEKWTLPAGYMENSETTAQGALRETFEESGAVVKLHGAYRLFDLPTINQMYLLFRGKMISCPFLPTSESSEVRLFRQDQIPWDQIAFPVIVTTLQHYYNDTDKNIFSFENHVITLK